MAIPEVQVNVDTIAVQAQKINQIAQLEGDLQNLTTSAKDNLVSAINEVKSGQNTSKRSLLVYALAMS